MNILDDRVTSSFNISIGTSLALETLFKGTLPVYDKTRIIPKRLDLSNYTHFYINIYTLYRNILGSIQAKEIKDVTIDNILDVMDSEIHLIKELISSISNTKLVVYASNYKSLDIIFPNALLRKDVTEKQFEYKDKLESFMKKYIGSHSKDELELIDLYILAPKESKVLILTNYAIDLLIYNNVNKLDLLESHTGVVKSKDMFYTKFTNGKDLHRIPFNKCTLQIFGDSQSFIQYPAKARQLVLDLANKYNWSQTTTKDRLLFSFNAMSDRLLSDTLKKMI